MGQHYILAIDQGTTGTTAMVLNVNQPNQVQTLGRATIDFPQHYPQPGWVEHDLDEIRASLHKAIQQACQIASSRDTLFEAKKLAAIGLTNQRETLCVFDRKTLRPLRKAIVWQCRRSAGICAQLRREGYAELVNERTGLLLDPYFSASKIRWIKENEPELMAKVSKGEAVFGTMDTFMLALLTNGRTFATEPSNASRTMLFNLAAQTWDDELLKIFGVPSRSALAEILDSAAEFGKTEDFEGLPDGIPITGILGDQQAALYGQACFKVGQSKCTYGTGAFLLVNAGPTVPKPSAGVLSTVAWRVGGQTTYALEGSVFIAGAAMQFARDQLNILDNLAESERIARGKRAAPEVYFVPALTGLGAPYWFPEARGALLGLTRGTDKGQIVRAFLEGICLQVVDLVNVINLSTPTPVSVLKVDGGASANDLLCQIQADLLSISVERPTQIETTVFGAGLIACLGAGILSQMDDLTSLRKVEKVFEPDLSVSLAKHRTEVLQGWHRAITAVKAFAGQS